MDWYQFSVAECLEEFQSDASSGLSEEEVKGRLLKYGPNALSSPPKTPRFVKFLKQFHELIILVLIGAAAVSGLLGEWVDAIAILSIVVLNSVIGFLQEEKAERVLEALNKLSAPNARVVRGGETTTVPSAEVVPGDIILLDARDHVPADCRIIDSRLLRIDEAALTGESQPVDKLTEVLSGKLPLGDMLNMAFSATTTVYGRGRAVAVATGMKTEMGKIARMLHDVKPEPTPLQKRLAEFGRLLVYGSGAVCALIFLLGILRGEELLEMFLTAVSLAVAAIPEGLPAVVTIVLALGVQRMVKRNALIRKLPSVETLGAATVIASDKTGTITQNQMTVKRLYLSTGEVFDVTGSGYAPTGELEKSSGKSSDTKYRTPLLRAMQVCVLCNGAELKEKADGGWQIIGDPTEGALLTLAAKSEFGAKTISGGMRLVSEIPFDAVRKMMTTIYEDSDGVFHAFIKGAPDRLLPRAALRFSEGDITTLDEEARQEISNVNDSFAGSAMRVLALGYRRSTEPFDISNIEALESGFVFAGLAAMIDPPRQEVIEAVAKSKAAGIMPLMITGDHKATAVAIAREIGVFTEGDLALSGEEFDRMEPEEFEEKLPRIKVYARVSPEHKLKVVQAWRRRGDIIAMTGDGVNDAPALKEADIGIAMGITGTDVTKEAADMVLTDDNFASIVSAVEEGRGIFDNIRRVVHFLLSCNIGEIFTLLVAALVGMPLPLLPVQILWMNLVTDGLPALGLAMEDVDTGVMNKPPRRKNEGLVTRSLIYVMLLQGAFMAACTLFAYSLELYLFDGSVDRARTIAFTVLVFCQKFHIYNCRSQWSSAFKRGIFSNKFLNLSVFFIFISQIAIIYIPWLREVFRVTLLAPSDWLLIFAVAAQPLLWMEIVKAFRRRRGMENNI